MRPNWFIGFPVDASPWIHATLAGRPPRVRAFAAADVHLTVAFLGPVGEVHAAAAWAVARAIERPVFRIRLGHLEPFGSRRRPSALSVVPVAGADPLAAWIEAHRDVVLDAAGVPRDPRPARPHVTLARPPRDATVTERDAIVAWARSVPPVDRDVDLDTLALYTWADDRRARQFRVVDSATTTVHT